MKKLSGHSGMSMSTDLHSGLTNKSPKAPSEMPKGASVDSDATRSTVAPNQTSIGGRCA